MTDAGAEGAEGYQAVSQVTCGADGEGAAAPYDDADFDPPPEPTTDEEPDPTDSEGEAPEEPARPSEEPANAFTANLFELQAQRSIEAEMNERAALRIMKEMRQEFARTPE